MPTESFVPKQPKRRGVDPIVRQLFDMAKMMDRKGVAGMDAEAIKTACVPEMLIQAGVTIQALQDGKMSAGELAEAWRVDVMRGAGGRLLGRWVAELPAADQAAFLQEVDDLVPRGSQISPARAFTWFKNQAAETQRAFLDHARAHLAQPKPVPGPADGPVVARIGMASTTPPPAPPPAPEPSAPAVKPLAADRLTIADKAALASPAVRWEEYPILLTPADLVRILQLRDAKQVSRLWKWGQIAGPVVARGNVVRWQKSTVRAALENRRQELIAAGVSAV